MDIERGPFHDLVREELFYQGLDEGIRFAVRVLHAAGVETFQSCQGGYGHAYDRPTVDLSNYYDGAVGFGALQALAAYDLPVNGVAIFWRVHRGLPTEGFWRVTFSNHMASRADDVPNFVYSAQSQWVKAEESEPREGGLA